MRKSSRSHELWCPACEREPDGGEGFCARCGMPLVPRGAEPLDVPVSEAHGRARKIDPRYAQGELVRVAGGRNQAEAEFIQNLLLEEGVPSMLRRSPGFDVPDFLAAGPRDVLVPTSGAEAANDVLLQTGLAPTLGAAAPSPLKLIAAITLGGGLAALVAWLLLGV